MSAAAAPPAAAASAAHVTPAASPESAAHLARLNRVREVCKGLLGPAGESVQSGKNSQRVPYQFRRT